MNRIEELKLILNVLHRKRIDLRHHLKDKPNDAISADELSKVMQEIFHYEKELNLHKYDEPRGL